MAQRFHGFTHQMLEPGDLVESYCTMVAEKSKLYRNLELPEDGQYYVVREVIHKTGRPTVYLRFEELRNPAIELIEHDSRGAILWGGAEPAFDSQYFKKVDSVHNKIEL